MLRTRIITAVVLAPLALLAIFRLDPDAFALFAGALLLVGTWEFRHLVGIPAPAFGVLLTLAQAAILYILFVRWSGWTANPIPPFATACVLWALMLTQLARYRPGRQPATLYRIRSTFFALAVITTGWMALAWLHREPHGQWWILVLLATIWCADSGAYFAGRAFGRQKLAPAISPGKTWAGFAGGLVLAALTPLIAVQMIPSLSGEVLPLVAMGVITALASVGGDLFISLHKRTVGCKDTGWIFPGHGGVLDRLDSLLAGAPFFALAKLLAGL